MSAAWWLTGGGTLAAAAAALAEAEEEWCGGGGGGWGVAWWPKGNMLKEEGAALCSILLQAHSINHFVINTSLYIFITAASS